MDFAAFREILFLGLGGFMVYIAKGIKDSVDKLNVQIAVVIEKTDNHEKRIDKLEGRYEG